MQYLLASMLYLFCIIAVMQQWLWLAVATIVWFSWRYTPAAFVPAAVVLDGYYGSFYTVPLLSIGAVAWLLAVEYLRPKLVSIRKV